MPMMPQIFACKRDVEIWYQPGKAKGDEQEGEAGGDDSLTHTSVLSIVPLEKLVGVVQHSMIAWSTRWTVRGLMPVRPHLVMNVDACIPAGKGILL